MRVLPANPFPFLASCLVFVVTRCSVRLVFRSQAQIFGAYCYMLVPGLSAILDYLFSTSGLLSILLGYFNSPLFGGLSPLGFITVGPLIFTPIVFSFYPDLVMFVSFFLVLASYPVLPWLFSRYFVLTRGCPRFSPVLFYPWGSRQLTVRSFFLFMLRSLGFGSDH